MGFAAWDYSMSLISTSASLLACACVPFGGKFIFAGKLISGAAFGSDAAIVVCLSLIVLSAVAMMARRDYGENKKGWIDEAYLLSMIFATGSFLLMNASAETGQIAVNQLGGVFRWNVVGGLAQALIFLWAGASLAQRFGLEGVSGPAFMCAVSLLAATIFFGAWDVPAILPEKLYAWVDGYVIDEFTPLAVFGLQSLVVVLKSTLVALFFLRLRVVLTNKFGSRVDAASAKVFAYGGAASIAFLGFAIASGVM